MGITQSGSLPTDLAERLMLGITEAQHMAGRELVKRVQDGMRQGKSGRIYGGHQASAPGEYSAVQTGDLIGSINYAIAGTDYITFYATSDHAGYQEFGTSRGIEARRNLIRAIEETADLIKDIIRTCVGRALGAP